VCVVTQRWMCICGHNDSHENVLSPQNKTPASGGFPATNTWRSAALCASLQGAAAEDSRYEPDGPSQRQDA
jgi:hypothetical protein